VVSDCGGVLVIDDPLSLLSMGVWLFAAGMWPVAFLFGACSPCCQDDDGCPWLLEFDRCLRVSIVGSDPPDGGDCRIVSALASSPGDEIQYVDSFRSTGGSGPIEIHYVQSRIKIGVRVDLSASGSSRTPVGETRNQVWRFNIPSLPSEFLVDVLGPPWHLQVDLAVTGVATQAEAGVQSSLGTDEHGQTKLVLTVNQWTDNITHEQDVTLFPVGLQRFQLRNTGTAWRLTGGGASATRVSGDGFTGWTVAKTSGIDIEERSLAVVIFTSVLCFSMETTGTKFFLDEATALSFISGDITLQVSSRDITVLPDNEICELPASDLSTGSAIGIYPHLVTANVSQSFKDRFPRVTQQSTVQQWCGPDTLTLRVGTSGWGLSYGRRNVPIQSIAGVLVSDFWAGRSLLWNLEQGPYRESVVRQGDLLSRPSNPIEGDVEYSLGGSEEFSIFEFGSLTCPAGFSSFGSSFRVCFAVPLPTFELTWSGPGGSGQEEIQLSGIGEALVGPDGQFIFSPDPTLDPADTKVTVGGGHIQLLNPNQNPFFHVIATISFEADFPCGEDDAGEISLQLREIVLSGPDNDQYTVSVTRLPSSSIPFVGVVRNIPPPVLATVLPASGGAIVEGGSLQPSTLSRLPVRLIDTPSRGRVIQEGSCRLLGVVVQGTPGYVQLNPQLAPVGPPNPDNPLPSPSFLSAAEGVCYYFRASFGSEFDTNNVSPSSRLRLRRTVPCDNCEVTVDQVSGQENGTVRYVSSGDKSGLIEVVATRTWFAAEGVTFTVSCGDDTITQTIQRIDDPITEAPINLVVVRDPCSTATLTWEPPPQQAVIVREYTVQFRRIGASTWTTFGSVTTTTAAVTGLLRLGYEFRVIAVNLSGSSPPSSVVTNGFNIVGGPTNLTVVSRNPCDQVELSWTAPTQSDCVVVANYRLTFRASTGFLFGTFGTVPGTQTTGIITGLDPTIAYQFRVVSLDDEGTELLSNIVSGGSAPSPPFNVVATLGANQGEIDLTWDAVEQLCFPNTDYDILFRETGTFFLDVFERPASSSKFATVTGLTAGVAYEFFMRATNSLGTNFALSPISNSVTIPVP